MSDQTQLDIVLRLKDEMSGKLSTINKGLAGIGSNLSSFGGTAMAGISALGAGIGVLGGMAVRSAADFEQTKIALTTMMGSAENAGNLLQDISKFAAATPFEMPELATTTKQLMAFGFSADDAMGGMKMLGDISAGLNVPIGDLAYLLGTLKAQGRAMTIDIRQFAMRGLPIYDALAEVMGVAKEKVGDLVTEGKVGFPEVEKALKLMTAEGGKFHGSMAAQATSLSGLYSTLKDNVGFALREIVGINLKGEVREGSIFEMVRNSAISFIAWLEANKENIAAFFTNLVNVIVNFGTQAKIFLEPVFNLIKLFFSDLENRKAMIIATLGLLTIAFVSWATTTIIAMAPMILTIGLIGSAIFILAKAWGENWGGMQEKTKAVMSAIVGFYNEYLVPYWNESKKKLDIMLKQWRDNWDNVKTIFQGVWFAIQGIFQVAWALLSGAFKIGIDIFSGNWKKAWEDVKKTFENVFKGIYTFIAGIFKAIIGVLGTMINGAIEMINKLIDKLNKVKGVDIGSIGKINTSDLQISSIPQLAVGTNYVPEDTLAYLHEGEAVLPKQYNPSAGNVNGGKTIVININGEQNYYNDKSVDNLIEKIKDSLSREQELADWGMA
ncbi:MAG TPA: hypothetical protein DDY21_00210 [Candidatus Moranbacteria bacterium]|nr:hypothetical protein [Candidatus Moranbacteria bacterium]